MYKKHPCNFACFPSVSFLSKFDAGAAKEITRNFYFAFVCMVNIVLALYADLDFLFIKKNIEIFFVCLANEWCVVFAREFLRRIILLFFSINIFLYFKLRTRNSWRANNLRTKSIKNKSRFVTIIQDIFDCLKIITLKMWIKSGFLFRKCPCAILLKMYLKPNESHFWAFHYKFSWDANNSISRFLIYDILSAVCLKFLFI